MAAPKLVPSSLCKNLLVVKKHINLHLGLLTLSGVWWSPIKMLKMHLHNPFQKCNFELRFETSNNTCKILYYNTIMKLKSSLLLMIRHNNYNKIIKNKWHYKLEIIYNRDKKNQAKKAWVWNRQSVLIKREV